MVKKRPVNDETHETNTQSSESIALEELLDKTYKQTPQVDRTISPQLEKELARTKQAYEPDNELLTQYQIKRSKKVDRALIFDSQRIDVNRPIIIFLAGGAYWDDITAYQFQLLRKLVDATGASAYALSYPKAPTYHAKDALAYLTTAYATIGELYPSSKIILMGDSAGAGLAMSFVQMLKEDKKKLPDQLILVSPWLDIELKNEKISDLVKDDHFLDRATLVKMGAVYRGDYFPGNDYHVSPIYGELAGFPPTLIIQGTHDIFLADVLRLNERITAENDSQFEVYVYPKMVHDFVIFDIPEAKQATQLIINKILGL